MYAMNNIAFLEVYKIANVRMSQSLAIVKSAHIEYSISPRDTCVEENLLEESPRLSHH